MNIKHECAEMIWRLDGAGKFQHVWSGFIDGKEYHYGEITSSEVVGPDLEQAALAAFGVKTGG